MTKKWIGRGSDKFLWYFFNLKRNGEERIKKKINGQNNTYMRDNKWGLKTREVKKVDKIPLNIEKSKLVGTWVG